MLYTGLALGLITPALAHEPVTRARTPIHLPDVPGFVTLKCDFHIHTVFSDGLVWPSVRAEEAWREGLDAIAITDHLEYQPHKIDVTTNHNRSFEIAKSAGADLDLLVVKGSEITRKMPPGHLNAIFLTNSTELAVDRWEDAVATAHNQGAFIFWNHPGWDAQTTNGLVIWYPEHTDLLAQGQLNGIEVVNGRDYYPEAHQWAIEKRLTLLSNSDIHNPLNLDYHVHENDHRPTTIVFAKSRTLEDLKEALFARRTAVYSGDRLIGDEEFLRPIFLGSLEVSKLKGSLRPGQRRSVQVYNRSSITYELERGGDSAELTGPAKLTLPAGKTVLLQLSSRKDAAEGTRKLSVPFKVTNLLVAPGTPLSASLEMEVTFTAPENGN
jgi:hypothetical protein